MPASSALVLNGIGLIWIGGVSYLAIGGASVIGAITDRQFGSAMGTAAAVQGVGLGAWVLGSLLMRSGNGQ